jgi:hypothetical protein
MMLSRIRKYVLPISLLALLVGLLLLAVFPSREMASYTIIETLTRAVPVADWDEAGLLLADGRHVPLPGLAKLPVTSEALSLATESGVEIDDAGNVVGLVRVHHWCGNDPCRTHLARVNLAHVLMYFREEKPTAKLPDVLTDEEWIVGGMPFSEWGWRVSEFHQFQLWSRLATEHGI